MSYVVAPIDVTKSEKVIDPRGSRKGPDAKLYKWWTSQNDKELCEQLLSTVEFLKRTNGPRIKQASIYARLHSGKPLSSFLAANSTLDSSNQLPIGRPTANVVYSCSDTLVSRISQDRPRPVFLTNGGNYKEQRLAEDANDFLLGEFHRMHAYIKGPMALRDATVLGDGLVKIFPKDDKVHLERTLETELLVDFNDAYYGAPRSLIQLKLVDRDVFKDRFPDKEEVIDGAILGSVDSSPRATQTTSDQFIAAEAWHLPSGEDAGDGRHVIVCSEGVILDEPWKRDKFPFAKIGYNPNLVGFFSQSLAEILMPGQMEIYRNLIIASQSIELMGVPRIYIDELSKILETSFNNRIGTIIKGRGPAPEFINPTSNNPEIYQWIQWLISNSYQMSGISSMSAQGTKPAGLDSGESIREFDDIQNDRFAALGQRYKDFYIELGYQVIECASEIVDETGKYTTVYPGKDGLREVDFKSIKALKNNFIIQCYDESSLPKDPAGRQARLSEMLAAGEIDGNEFRQLRVMPDLKASDELATALRNRILYCLDEIIENGDKNYRQIAPDPYLLDGADTASKLCADFINLYSTRNLEEEKLQILRNWWTQMQALKQAAMPPPPTQVPPPGAQPPMGNLPPPVPPQQPMAPTSNVAV